jgi:serine/threonine-protein kinase
MSAEAATAALTSAGFVVVEPASEEYSNDVPEGSVITTTPEITAGMPKGTEVHLVVSLGPEPVAFPDFAGMSTVNFSAQLAQLGIGVVDTSKEFNKSIPAGNVIKVSHTDGTEIKVGDTVYAGDSVLLTESVGKVPSVMGMTIEEATATLATVDLTVNGRTTQEFSTAVEAGRVISVTSAGGAIHPGGVVSLVVSKGPELVTVPSVTGLTIDAAQKLLTGLGFSVTVMTDIPKSHWAESWALAAATDPAEGTEMPKGSAITLQGKI